MGATYPGDDDPGTERTGERSSELAAARVVADSSDRDLPSTCQPGRQGRVHELSDSLGSSSSYDVAAGEMIERGTCRCGEYVARFVFEGQSSAAIRGPLFPVAELASVVAGLAVEPLGPERGLVSCGVCQVSEVTVEAHFAGGCLAIPEPVADVDDSEHARLLTAQAALAEIGWSHATDQELVKLAAADPWGEGDVVRGARLGDTGRIEPSLVELNRALAEAGKRSMWPYFVVAAGLALLVMFLIAQIFGR